MLSVVVNDELASEDADKEVSVHGHADELRVHDRDGHPVIVAEPREIRSERLDGLKMFGVTDLWHRHCKKIKIASPHRVAGNHPVLLLQTCLHCGGAL